jgi:hypothetical protein
MPAERLHRFGWKADPVEFPTLEVATAGTYTAPSTSDPAGTTTYGYQVALESGTGQRAEDVYLDGTIEPNLLDTRVIVRSGGSLVVADVSEQGGASVAFRRGRVFEYTTGESTTESIVVETQISNAVTYLRLDVGGTIARSTVALHSTIYGGWQFEADVLATEPNPDVVAAPLEIEVSSPLPSRSHLAFETLEARSARSFRHEHRPRRERHIRDRLGRSHRPPGRITWTSIA